MAERYDAIVVGGGHNGLVAGFYLARAGLRTAILERREIVGGACVTEELAPGFRASPGAYVLSMLRRQIWQDMRLRQRGLTVLPSGPSLHLYADGTRFTTTGDNAEDVAEIRRFSRRDADEYVRFDEHLAKLAQFVMPFFDQPPPDPAMRSMQQIRGVMAFGVRAVRHRQLLRDLAYIFSTSMAQYLGEHFETEILKSALGWASVSNTLAGPNTPGTSYVLLHDHAVADSSGDGRSWGFVPGGMGVVTGLMADAAREAGATVRTGAEVERILTRGGRATGVLLAGGEEINAPIVLSNADPKRTFLGLVDRSALPTDFLEAVGAYRSLGASLKINLALSELPHFKGMPSNGVQPYHRGIMQFTAPLSELDWHQSQARRGIPAEDAHIEFCIPTVTDPSQAPEGTHVVTMGVRSQPYKLREGRWDDIKESVADRVIRQLGQYMPNLPGAILHRQVLSPLDLERTMYLTGGHHLHGGSGSASSMSPTISPRRSPCQTASR